MALLSPSPVLTPVELPKTTQQPLRNTDLQRKTNRSILDIIFEAARIFNMNSHYLSPTSPHSAYYGQAEE